MPSLKIKKSKSKDSKKLCGNIDLAISIAAVPFLKEELNFQAPNTSRLKKYPSLIIGKIFDSNLMLVCADLVSCVTSCINENKGIILQECCSFVKAIFLKQDPKPVLFAIIIKHNLSNSIIIAFRGTSTKYEGMVYDGDICPSDNGFFLGCSNGFVQSLENLYLENSDQDIYQFIKSIPNINNIIITGHSLGAAVATLFAIKLNKQCLLYTFGSPRVISYDFNKKLLSKIKTFRIFNQNDPIPSIPAAADYIQYYTHIGYPIVLNFDGKIAADNHFFYMKELISNNNTQKFILN
jgi:hypothetical protein